MSEIYGMPEYQENDFDMVFDALSIYRNPVEQGYTLTEACSMWHGMRKALFETRGYSELEFAKLQRLAAYVLDGISAMERELRKK